MIRVSPGPPLLPLLAIVVVHTLVAVALGLHVFASLKYNRVWFGVLSRYLCRQYYSAKWVLDEWLPIP